MADHRSEVESVVTGPQGEPSQGPTIAWIETESTTGPPLGQVVPAGDRPDWWHKKRFIGPVGIILGIILGVAAIPTSDERTESASPIRSVQAVDRPEPIPQPQPRTALTIGPGSQDSERASLAFVPASPPVELTTASPTGPESPVTAPTSSQPSGTETTVAVDTTPSTSIGTSTTTTTTTTSTSQAPTSSTPTSMPTTTAPAHMSTTTDQGSSTTTQSCDPNYSGCVPIASDVDCEGAGGDGPAYVRGPVRVIGTDIYGLDRNGNGIGCEGPVDRPGNGPPSKPTGPGAG